LVVGYVFFLLVIQSGYSAQAFNRIQELKAYLPGYQLASVE
jgi:hypothetical protein